MGQTTGEFETANVLHLFVAIALTLGLPLLPMVLSWFKYLSA
ncbi:hypothetical protein [Marinifaba aquimaris]|nr:hypothetical protein [Marinifaba aquimaris]